MRRIILTLCCISISFSLLSDLMTPRTLEEAIGDTSFKIVYVGMGAASETDTYKAYPLFMQKLSIQYPGLCKTIDFGAGWPYAHFPEGLLLQRDVTLNTQNFFIIYEQLYLRTIYTVLRPHLNMILAKGGCVILGKFINYAAHYLELQVLYMWLLNENPQFKDRILLFSTDDGVTSYWWQGAPYSLYDDLIATERSVERKLSLRQEMRAEAKKKGATLISDAVALIAKDALDEQGQAALFIPEKTDEQLAQDIRTKHIEHPKVALGDTGSLVIDVVKKQDAKNGVFFSIQDVYFLNETLENLYRSLQLIALVANTR